MSAPVRTADPQPGSPAAPDRGVAALVGRLQVDRRLSRMAVLLVVAFAFFAVQRPGVFLNPINLQNIMVATPEIGVLALAMTLAMLTGGIDLSLVAVANLSAISMSMTFSAIAASDPARAEQSAPLLVLVGAAVGLACGLVNGLLVSRLGITPILATLGSMQVFNGLAIVWTGGSVLYGSPEVLTATGRSTVAGVPVLFLVFLLVAVAVAVLVNRTPVGLKIQLQGANPVAARYSGVDSRSVLMRTYLLTGLLGGVAGVLFLTRNPTASADYGASYVLLVIVIAVLGGTNPNGGFATVAGVVLAALTLQIVASGFTAIRLTSYHYAIAQGVILIAVMVSDQVRWRRRGRRPRTDAQTAEATVREAAAP